MEERMTCSKCPHYSRGLGRCKLGKVNPRSKKNTLSAKDFGGWGYICLYNPWKREAMEAVKID